MGKRHEMTSVRWPAYGLGDDERARAAFPRAVRSGKLGGYSNSIGGRA